MIVVIEEKKRLSDYASDKCKDRVAMLDDGNKEFCMDSKLKRGVATCAAMAYLREGSARDMSEALQKGWGQVKKICNGGD